MMTDLDIAGKTTVELRGNELYAEAKTGNKHWIAAITDTHPQYNYERDFAMYQKPKTSNRDKGTAPIADGAVIEYVRYTHSGKNRKERYYQLVDGEAYQIDEEDITDALEGETIPNVGPDEETIDELTTVDGIGDSRAEALAEAGYESIDTLENATTDDLETVAGIGPATAETIVGALTDDETDDMPVAIADGGHTPDDVSVGTIFETQENGTWEVVDRRGPDKGELPVPSIKARALESPSAELGHEEWLELDGEVLPSIESILYSDDVVLSPREAEADGRLVRQYRTPPGDSLYAYRAGNHHIVVSRGSEPGERWEKRTLAKRTRVVAGQQLWTIPDNWDERAHVTRDSIAYGLFEVPETGRWVKLSIPTNDWLGDAWYGVTAVGDLTIEPVGEIGSARDVRRLADEYEDKYDADGVAEDAEAIREVADNWESVETDLEMTLEWVRDEGLDQQQPGDQPISLSEDWELEFHQDRVFRPGEALAREIDFSEYEIPDGVLLDELRNAGLLPSYYKFELRIDTDAVGMEHATRALIEAGCSPAEALDYYMTEIRGLTHGGWADERGISQPSVSTRVSDAKTHIKA